MKRFLGYSAAAILGIALVAGTANAFGPGHGDGGCAYRSGEMGRGMDFGEHRGRFGGQRMQADLDLTVDQARDLLEARLIRRGNDRLKVGAVTEKDADTILAEIMTVDDSLVQQMEIDRDSGRMRPVR